MAKITQKKSKIITKRPSKGQRIHTRRVKQEASKSQVNRR